MKCTIDIKREGKFVIARLPFNPRTEFGLFKGTMYAKCTIDGVEFKSKLMSRGNEKYCIFFGKQLLKNLGLNGEEHLNVELDIQLDGASTSEVAEPEIFDNETIRTITERLSIRSFIDKKISNLLLDTILNSGLCAPSATNKRPFHIVVTQNREKMTHIMKNNSNVKMLSTAAGCIIVCGDKIVQGIPEWLIEDCSAATQNMLLAIHSLRLGGVWCGVKQGSDFYNDIIHEFGLPSHIRPVSLIAFGYTDENKVQPNRFETSKIHYEFW